LDLTVTITCPQFVTRGTREWQRLVPVSTRQRCSRKQTVPPEVFLQCHSSISFNSSSPKAELYVDGQTSRFQSWDRIEPRPTRFSKVPLIPLRFQAYCREDNWRNTRNVYLSLQSNLLVLVVADKLHVTGASREMTS